MDHESYHHARDLSRGLFNNALILPVAVVIEERVAARSDFTAADVRGWLGGRSADNQIREALRRIESTAAIAELPYPGRPHPHRWQRTEHPLWRFVAEWVAVGATR